MHSMSHRELPYEGQDSTAGSMASLPAHLLRQFKRRGAILRVRARRHAGEHALLHAATLTAPPMLLKGISDQALNLVHERAANRGRHAALAVLRVPAGEHAGQRARNEVN